MHALHVPCCPAPNRYAKGPKPPTAWLLAVGCALLAASCVSSQFADGQFRCDPDGGSGECPEGMTCAADQLCRSAGGEPSTCYDGKRDGDEVDKDCAGSCKARCKIGNACTTEKDCISQRCISQACACPSDMVDIAGALPELPHFCIDATEVSNSAWSGFMTTRPALSRGPRCGWALEPWNTAPPCTPADGASGPSMPAVCMNWCDAQSFCISNRKRLCGRVLGGTNAIDNRARSEFSQWFQACAACDGMVCPSYSSGSTLAAGCSGPSKPLPVEVAAADCAGPNTPTLLGMSGNVWEWEDSCDDGATGPGNSDTCLARGGASNLANLSDFSCASALQTILRGDANATVGFRCCLD